ncbi:probable RNA-binding protein 19 isoform X2 [Bombus pascuorum]|uniref:probable RNA-binding protein 19 isoform X2 n=1 Tax=Bombus pascuorum TaxID=65598 RepID=UPI00298E37D0|nr:probable RNA-binding protein 19 isoform X2 [Bombus pascuorum]
MSRLIVKNLPKNITDTKLKELFSEKGLITDVQLKYTKDGKFRRFAFIGLKTEEQATAVKEYFDQTCIDTCRISIEQCASLGDSSKPRAWSKYAPDSSKGRINNKDSTELTENIALNKRTVDEKKDRNKKGKKEEGIKKEIKEALEKHKDDPLFMEFLETHTKDKAIWKNDTILTAIQTKEHSDNEINDSDSSDQNNDKEDSKEKEDEEEEKKEKEQKIADKVISDLEYMESLKGKKENIEKKLSNDKSKSKHGSIKLFTVKLRGLAYNHKKKNIKEFFHPLKAKSIRISPKIKGIAYVGFETEQHLRKALLKNKSFLDGRQIFVMKYEAKEFNSDEAENKEDNVRWKKQLETLKSEETIAESGRMFIRNLSYTITEDNIRQLFEKYGPLSEVNLPIDRTTRKPKGFGTITFLMAEHAVKAYSELDGSILDGRMLHVLPAKAKSDPMEELDGRLTYKQKKELKAKATAGSSHNWNTLFLGQNAVAETIATTYNTTKEKVLEDGSKGLSAAVKLALGETQLVHDSRKFLEENGVCLDAFNQPPNKRSKTVILVKNLPAASPAQEIRQLFARHGELGRFVMPPSGITALVEFLEPSEARKAFTQLAYTKYKHLPLYLEWAPDNSFTTPPPAGRNKATEVGANDKKNIKEVDKQAEVFSESINGTNKANKEESDDEDEPEQETTLFVKNINFTTTEEQLKTYFGKCGPLHYVSIATKKDPKNPGAKLSMGYGFVRYKRKVDADRALKVLQMTVLEGKTIELKRSERTLTSDLKSAKKTSTVTAQTGTKILIRNVPFQATVEEVTELFKAFGELKAVRLPKKLVGVEKHRGFAFVEYYTKSEAKKAFKALCQSTHLYGRRLVLEWAQTEEGVEEVRKRTAKHFYQDQPVQKRKKATLNPEDVGLQDALL